MTLAELRALESKATPGEWVDNDGFLMGPDSTGRRKHDFLVMGDYSDAWWVNDSDRLLIVALRNAAPALLAVAEAAMAHRHAVKHEWIQEIVDTRSLLDAALSELGG